MIVSAQKGRKRVSGARYPIRRALLMTELCPVAIFEFVNISQYRKYAQGWESARSVSRPKVRRATLSRPYGNPAHFCTTAILTVPRLKLGDCKRLFPAKSGSITLPRRMCSARSVTVYITNSGSKNIVTLRQCCANIQLVRTCKVGSTCAMTGTISTGGR